MRSVLSPNSLARTIGRVETSLLKQLYSEIDIHRFFDGIDHIEKMECEATGYVWYAPSCICGDGKFYEDLYGKQSQDYYPEWRWAWGEALKHIQKGDKVLEIGSGGLVFLHHLKKIGIEASGLEINPNSILKAKQMGLRVYDKTIETIASEHQNQYDVIMFFEVLEHVYDVHSFLHSALQTLKLGGKMIFSVPNNDSFIKDEVLKLNLPPHHVGLWTPRSIENIAKVFSLHFKSHYFEPLSEGHANWFLSVMERNTINKWPRILQSIYFRLGFRKRKLNQIKRSASNLRGQTILSVFEKK